MSLTEMQLVLRLILRQKTTFAFSVFLKCECNLRFQFDKTERGVSGKKYIMISALCGGGVEYTSGFYTEYTVNEIKPVNKYPAIRFIQLSRAQTTVVIRFER